jgi:hypothetical protein
MAYPYLLCVWYVEGVRGTEVSISILEASLKALKFAYAVQSQDHFI